jgi:hypothetical protein
VGWPLLFAGGWQWQQLLLYAHRFKGVSHFLPVTNIRQIVLDYLTASEQAVRTCARKTPLRNITALKAS